MKRRVYEILKDGQVIATKHSWNAARREIRSIVRSQLTTPETAELFSYHFNRNEEEKRFVDGNEIWHTTNGRALVFEIKQVV